MTPTDRSVVVASLDSLLPELQETLRAARTPEGWDQRKVQQVVRHDYDFLGPFIEARIQEEENQGPVLVIEFTANEQRDVLKGEEAFAEAASMADRGDIAGALPLLAELVKKFPEVPKYRRALGQAYMALGDLDNAEDELLRALRLDPLDASAHTVLGNIYAGRNRQDHAIGFYRRSIELEPSVYALNNLAAALAKTGLIEEGIRTFREALNEDPSYPQAWYGLGLALTRKRDRPLLREAIQALDQALRLLDQRYREPQLWDLAQQQLLGLVPLEAEEEAVLARKINEEVAEAEGVRQGMPVKLVTNEDLPVLAKIEYGWVHQRSFHRVVMQSAAVPVRDHHVRHELEHLRLTNLARNAGRNRWFASNDSTKERAFAGLQDHIERLSRSLSPQGVSGFMDSVFHGLMGQLYNFPVDLLIERRVLQSHPELRELVFASVWQQLQTAVQAAHDPQLQDLAPPVIFHANAAMNGAFALWSEEEFPKRTDIVDRFQDTEAWPTAQKLYRDWKVGAAEWTPGDELDWVDDWADLLGLSGWYYWIEDDSQA